MGGYENKETTVQSESYFRNYCIMPTLHPNFLGFVIEFVYLSRSWGCLPFPKERVNSRRFLKKSSNFCRSRREGQTEEDIRQDIFELHCPRHAPRHDKSHEVTKTHQNPLTVLSMTHY